MKPNEPQRLMAEPLYKRAESAMVARIVDRVWSPGMRLPNEFELAEEFGVSQGTIRKALVSLEKRGLLARSPGRGTTVAKTTEQESLYAFFRLRGADGRMAVPAPAFERIKRRNATRAEAAVLGPDCAEVYQIERVRQNRGTRFAYEKMSLPVSLCEGMEADTPLPNALYPYLQERFGISIMAADDAISAAAAAAKPARMLEIAPGTPLLKVERQASDLTDRIVELRTSLFLTSFATYQVHLSKSDMLAVPSDIDP